MKLLEKVLNTCWLLKKHPNSGWTIYPGKLIPIAMIVKESREAIVLLEDFSTRVANIEKNQSTLILKGQDCSMSINMTADGEFSVSDHKTNDDYSFYRVPDQKPYHTSDDDNLSLTAILELLVNKTWNYGEETIYQEDLDRRISYTKALIFQDFPFYLVQGKRSEVKSLTEIYLSQMVSVNNAIPHFPRKGWQLTMIQGHPIIKIFGMLGIEYFYVTGLSQDKITLFSKELTLDLRIIK